MLLSKICKLLQLKNTEKMIFETAAVLIFSSVGYVLVRLVSGFQGIGVCWGLVNVVLLLLLWLLKKGGGGGGGGSRLGDLQGTSA